MPLSTPAKPDLRIVLCSPRGFCAGVVRAIDTVERALTIYGAPVYVRHEIVHNRYVVDSLKTKGAIFVEELAEIPDNTNAPVVFSAHGVPKSVPADARARISSRWMRPVPWSRKCTARPRSISSEAAKSC